MAAWQVERFIIYRVLHMDDTPHRIALSVAIGVFVAWTPTVGLQMVLALLLCSLLRANRLVGVPLVWLSNPFTIILIYYPNYWLGVRIVPGARAVALSDWRIMVSSVFDGNLSPWDRAWGFWEFAVGIAGPLWVGSLLVALLIGAAMYWVSYVAVVRYRRRFGRHRPRVSVGVRRRGVL